MAQRNPKAFKEMINGPQYKEGGER